jgi:peptide/nickel transport system permease protein
MSETTTSGDRLVETPGTDLGVTVGGGTGTTTPPVRATEMVGRSPNQLAWLRLKRDRTAIISLFIVLAFAVVAIAAPLIEWVYGLGPNEGNSNLLDRTGLPLGYLGGIDFTTNNADHHIHILGVEPQTGRDIFIRLVYGARTSLVIAVSASIISVIFGAIIGVMAGYFGGWIDSVLNWFIDFMLAFPFILFSIAAIPVINSWIGDETGDVSPTKRIITIIVIFSAFGWLYTARLVRGMVLSVREREYVEAARAAGAGGTHIMFRQILPNLWAPILVTFSLSLPATVTAEAALSFLNIGVIEPTADWGRMINASTSWMHIDPMYTFIPGFAIWVLVLTFNLFGDALRDALDPKSAK